MLNFPTHRVFLASSQQWCTKNTGAKTQILVTAVCLNSEMYKFMYNIIFYKFYYTSKNLRLILRIFMFSFILLFLRFFWKFYQDCIIHQLTFSMHDVVHCTTFCNNDVVPTKRYKVKDRIFYLVFKSLLRISLHV